MLARYRGRVKKKKKKKNNPAECRRFNENVRLSALPFFLHILQTYYHYIYICLHQFFSLFCSQRARPAASIYIRTLTHTHTCTHIHTSVNASLNALWRRQGLFQVELTCRRTLRRTACFKMLQCSKILWKVVLLCDVLKCEQKITIITLYRTPDVDINKISPKISSSLN
jgi:hypothetical protein